MMVLLIAIMIVGYLILSNREVDIKEISVERVSKEELNKRAKEHGIEPSEGLVSIEITEPDQGRITIYETDSSPEA